MEVLYWVQLLIIDCRRKLEQLLTDLRLTNLRDKWADLSLSLCVLSPWDRPESKWRYNTLSVRNISDGHMTPLLLSLPLWKSFALTRVLPHVKDAVTICTLGIGTAFGESILDNTPRHATIVTREFSELLRIEQREFRTLWEVCQSTDNIYRWHNHIREFDVSALYLHSHIPRFCWEGIPLEELFCVCLYNK